MKIKKNIKNYVVNLCKQAKVASQEISCANENKKNNVLKSLIKNINNSRDAIIVSNSKDVENLKSSKNFTESFVDRLLIDNERIDSIIASLEEVIIIKDPVGEIKNLETMPSGIKVGKMAMPLGVNAMIYESRPNVTVDASALCIKSGNSIILRGGTESINTNLVLANSNCFSYPEIVSRAH